MRSLSPLLLLLAAAGLAAVESGIVVADVRVGLGIAPMPDEFSGTATAPAAQAGTAVTNRYEGNPGLAAVITSTYGRLQPVGALIGVQFQSVTGEQEFKSSTYGGTTVTASAIKVPGMSFSQTSMAANLGVGWALSPGFHLELMGIAGLAWTSMQAPPDQLSTDVEVQQADDWGGMFGGRLGAYWTSPESGWQCGLELEYTTVETDLSFAYPTVTIDSTLENEGLGVRFAVGRRF